MRTANRDGIRVDDLAVIKHRDSGGSSAHIHEGDAEVDLVFNQTGQAGRVGCCDRRLDIQVTALDAACQVPNGCTASRNEVHIDRHPLSKHAARILNAGG